VPPEHARAVITARGGRSVGQIPQIGLHAVQLPPGANETAVARAFGQRAEVRFAELDQIVPLDLSPNDPSYSYQWHLPKIGASAAWDTTTGSPGVIIAILDTGVDGAHPDLAGKMVAGWNFYDNNANTSDVHGHGTSVAGTAGAVGNNGIGMASPAWGCRLMPLRVSDHKGYAYLSTIANALTWAADHGARVANASFQATGSGAVKSAAQYFQSKKGVVTISAGNSGAFDAAADNPYVLTVSATDSSDALASWSNTGNNVDLAAPGVSVYTTVRGGAYGSASGTSFSAPLVAGVAALVISVNPELTADQVQNILKQSADDLGGPGWDTRYGHGRVNAGRAVSLAAGAAPPPPAPGPGPTADTTAPTIRITSPPAGTLVSTNVTVTVSASDDRGVVKVELYVDGKLTATSTSAPFSTKWNARKAAPGAHTLQCKAYDAAGNVGVSAAVTVSR
jgi:subtilisin family serine protease